MKISREDVLRVAELAHLELSEAETEAYRRQLDSILTYMDKLNQLDVSAIEPMAQVLFAQEESAGPLREDRARCLATAEDLLRQAPEANPPYFRVPKVIER